MSRKAAEAAQALYRFYDSENALLYIGITFDPGSRWRKHADDKPWWQRVARIEIETHPDRETVLAAERAAIDAEQPIFNVVHNGRTTAARRGTATSRRLLRVDPRGMSDDCHNACVRVGVYAAYFPYRWGRGVAEYECVVGHRWHCGWPGSGVLPEEAPEYRGKPQNVLPDDWQNVLLRAQLEGRCPPAGFVGADLRSLRPAARR